MDFENGEFQSRIISTDEKSDYSKSQRKSVKSYATRVFQESTIGIVASIASSHSNTRKLFKSLVMILCIIGFSYQCTSFLLHVFQYPTTIDVKIREIDDHVILPGITFCNNNGIKRSDFCGKFPDRCHLPSAKFCKIFAYYCAQNGSKPVPKRDYYNLEDSLDYEEILQMGIDDRKEFLPEDMNYFSNEIRGPYMRTKSRNEGAMLCYTLHSVSDSSEYPHKRPKTDFFARNEPYINLTFRVKGDDMFVPGIRPGVLFTIHSPYRTLNPFNKGFFLKQGRDYRIYVSMEIGMLLEGPFKTDCVNYTEIWLANNRTGPRIQEMCKEKCMMDFYLACYNCVGSGVLYPSREDICNKDDIKKPCSSEIRNTLTKCVANCKNDCQVIKYFSEIMERYEVDYGTNEGLDDYDQYITVQIILEDKEVVIYEHSPKYLSVEVFSSIGGFIGCWLGISLMDIIDVLTSSFSVFRYSIRK